MPKKNSYITATDQFCGAGGSTTGAKEAGVEVKMALNHWDLAIETHNTNHPETDHDCTNIQACDPRRYPSTDILITSPECTSHSLAKGTRKKYQNQLKLFGKIDLKPEEERSRATMWDVPRFAEYHDYNIIIVENVVDARYWRLFDAWLKSMHDLGYKHKCNYLNSMFFHPCPQSRDRMYVVFWKKNNNAPELNFSPKAPCPKCGITESYQSWKKSEKKWGKYRQQYVYHCSGCHDVVMPFYYAAFNAIDWSIPGTRIGDRKKPLAEKTIARIRYGLEKYGRQSLILNARHTSGLECRVKTAIEVPLGTQTTQQDHGLAIPFIIRSEHGKIGLNTRHGTEPIWTQTSSQSLGMVVPFVVEMNRTGKARTVSEHLSTILSSGNHHMLIGNYTPGWSRTLDKPTGSITTKDHHGLLAFPLIVENNGQSKTKSSLNSIGTVTSNINHGLLSMPIIVQNHGSSNAKPAIEGIGTQTTRDTFALLAQESLQAFLSYYYSGSNMASGAFEATNTIRTRDGIGLVYPTQEDIDNCHYRMLKPHEIQSAMAFEKDYVVLGNSRQKVKQLGNAVTPPVMEWLVQRCIESFE